MSARLTTVFAERAQGGVSFVLRTCVPLRFAPPNLLTLIGLWAVTIWGKKKSRTEFSSCSFPALRSSSARTDTRHSPWATMECWKVALTLRAGDPMYHQEEEKVWNRGQPLGFEPRDWGGFGAPPLLGIAGVWFPERRGIHHWNFLQFASERRGWSWSLRWLCLLLGPYPTCGRVQKWLEPRGEHSRPQARRLLC